MAKRGRHPHKRGRQAARDKRRQQTRPGHGSADLLSVVAQRLASGEPLDFLEYVSNLLAAVDPRGQTAVRLRGGMGVIVGQPLGVAVIGQATDRGDRLG